MAIVLPNGKQQFFATDGSFGNGFKLYTYVAGTSTPKATYTDYTGGTPNANPVIANTRGEMTVYWDGVYDVTLKDASDVTIWGPERLATPEIAGTSATLRSDLVDATSASNGDALVTVKRTAANAVSKTLHQWHEAQWFNFDAEFLTDGLDPTTTDCSSLINNALLAIETAGGGNLQLGPHRYAISSTIRIPDYCGLVGCGRHATEIFLLASSNVNLIEKKVGATGLGAYIGHLKINGNDANNTAGGVWWVGAASGRGPVLTMEGVHITKCEATVGSGAAGAVVLEGTAWGVLRDCDIDQNQNAVGLWHKGSDWMFDSIYFGPNGATANGGTGGQSVIVQGGAGNLFSHCYFGGNGGLEQVLLWGSARNIFVGCLNDNSWESAYRLIDFSGTPSSNNMFIGGQISHSGGKTDDTYPAVSIEGAAADNLFASIQWDGDGHTTSTYQSNYGIYETGTAGNNHVIGGILKTVYGTGFKSLLAAGGSSIQNIAKYNGEGVASITVGASPYTYTNQDHVLEAVYISGGTVSDVTKNATTIFTATGCTVVLAAGEAVTVTYSSAPTMLKDRK